MRQAALSACEMALKATGPLESKHLGRFHAVEAPNTPESVSLPAPTTENTQNFVASQTHHVPRIPLEQIPQPELPSDLALAIQNGAINLSDVVEEIYDESFDPKALFTDEDWQRYQRFSEMEHLINRGLIVITAPVWLPMAVVASIVTKLESPGPIVFAQTRIGLKGKPFKIYKLRTMRTDASGPSYTQSNDPRITRFGALFRRWKVDELFQFYNVFRGDMNIIGRRPLVPCEAFAALDTDHRYGWILLEKPGLASLGQINSDHCSTVADNLRKFEIDLFGMVNKSPKMFAQVFLGAAIAILKGTGVR